MDSVELKNQVEGQRIPGKVLGRYAKCYKVIGVKIGSFFLVKKVTPLTMLAMISNTTMTLLISVNFSF